MSKGTFGTFGGQYVPETLMTALHELEEAFDEAMESEAFHEELHALSVDYVGRETPLYEAEQLTKALGGARIFLKREDLNHTGAHKINNTLGQVLLARRMGKKKIVAETGAGQHGVATATMCARFGMECIVFMGAVDVERQKLNVFRMELLGATVVPVEDGAGTLKDAVNEALRYWVTHVDDTHYVLGSALGPHPFPTMVKQFQRVIGDEAKAQHVEKTGKLPDALVACVGGGSNAIGLFAPFVDDASVNMYGVEAGGEGVETGRHSAAVAERNEGMLHGARMYLLQDDGGNIRPTYSISAGLDYPAVGPEHSYLDSIGRVTYDKVTDDEALAAFRYLSEVEGIIPALESAHAIAYVRKLAPTMAPDETIVVSLSGRGDKDIHSVYEALGGERV